MSLALNFALFLLRPGGLLLSDVYATGAEDRAYLMRQAATALNHLRSRHIGRAELKIMRLARQFSDVLKKADFEPLSPTHPSALEAMREIDAEGRFRIFGFGESHAWGSIEGLTTLEHFSESILPYLVRERGVALLGLEFLSVDWAKDVSYFLPRGDEEPGIEYYRRREIKRLLERAAALKREGYSLSIEGLGPPYFMEFRDEIWPSGKILPYNEQTKHTDNRAEELILRAKQAGERIALYTGQAHNTLSSGSHRTPTSYAQSMLDRGVLSAKEYLELSLFTIHQRSSWGTMDPVEYFGINGALTEGVYVRRWGENRVGIVFGNG